MRHRIVFFVIVSILWVMSGCETPNEKPEVKEIQPSSVETSPAAAADAPETEVTERTLASLKQTNLAQGITRSGDELRIAWSQPTQNGKWIAVIDGRAGKVYDEVASIVFSPNSKRVAYSARNGSKWVIVLDGIEGPEYDDISMTCIVFSPDSDCFAYGAKKGNKWVAVVDGQAWQEHDFVGYFAFSPDSSSFVYAAGKGMRQSVVVDGVAGKAYELTGEPVFSPDGKHLAYVASIDLTTQPLRFVVLDGKEGKIYDGVNKPIFSIDSSHIAYSVMEGLYRMVVVDGQEGPKFDMVPAIEPVIFGPNDNRVAYSGKKGNNKWVVVVEDREGPEYDGIGKNSIVLSSDGKRHAYVAEKEGKWLVVTDGQEGPLYNGVVIGSPIFSSDGKRLVYAATKDGKWFVVMDGQTGPAYDYNDISDCPQFSPDGRHLFYMALKGDKWFLVVDGQEGQEGYDHFFKPAFKADGVEYLAERNGWLMRCKQPYAQSGGKDKLDVRKLVEKKIGKSSQPDPNEKCKTCPPPERNRKY